MSTPALSFEHRFVPATRPGQPPLLLLHGTGGDETDLLDLGAALAPGSALLSPRGKVLERGMPRFFARLAEGMFDQAEVERRSLDLADFIATARQAYGLAAPVAVGYSNGANAAAAAMLLRPGCLAGAILFRPMKVLDRAPEHPPASAPVLVLSGQADPIVPASSLAALVAQLERSGAAVDHRVLATGHQLGQADLVAARAWLTTQFPPEHHN